MTTLLEFWNSSNVRRIHLVGLSHPAGVEYVDTTDTKEDGCDLLDLLEQGLIRDGWHDLTGTVSEDGLTWTWDGHTPAHDNRGNDWRSITVHAPIRP